MPQSLSIIAELGIGLAGFSAVVVALGYRTRRLSPLDRLRLIGLLLGSLGAALFATLPQVIADSGIGQATIWRTSSSVFAVYLVVISVYALSVRRSLPDSDRAALHAGMWVVVVIGFPVLALILAWNAVGWQREPSAGPFLAGLCYLLFYSSAQFMRLLLVRPVD